VIGFVIGDESPPEGINVISPPTLELPVCTVVSVIFGLLRHLYEAELFRIDKLTGLYSNTFTVEMAREGEE
jgi:hypothetical protein